MALAVLEILQFCPVGAKSAQNTSRDSGTYSNCKYAFTYLNVDVNNSIYRVLYIHLSHALKRAQDYISDIDLQTNLSLFGNKLRLVLPSYLELAYP